ncbi:MAG: hypothetical protein H7287_05510 [Thermoleophilia bacterium]|nr:hypothetical protein [Thermoleophilia bacterium]
MQLTLRTAPALSRPLDVVADGRLTLAAEGPDGHAFVSGASGVATVGGASWVISDSSPQPARFGDWNAPGVVQSGLPERARRYDLETITTLTRDARGGALLLSLGSGSKGDRTVGFAQNVDATGAATSAPLRVDVAPLFKHLAKEVDGQLNIEGAAVRDALGGAELLLFNRGQSSDHASRVFVLDAAAVSDAIRSGTAVTSAVLRSSHAIDLGRLDNGARLAFSDAHALADGRIVFSASSETSAGGGDGAITGSAIGILDRDLRVTVLHPLAGPPRKVEGITMARDLDPSAPADRVIMITDPDDNTVAGERLHVDLGTALS